MEQNEDLKALLQLGVCYTCVTIMRSPMIDRAMGIMLSNDLNIDIKKAVQQQNKRLPKTFNSILRMSERQTKVVFSIDRDVF